MKSLIFCLLISVAAHSQTVDETFNTCFDDNNPATSPKMVVDVIAEDSDSMMTFNIDWLSRIAPQAQDSIYIKKAYLLTVQAAHNDEDKKQIEFMIDTYDRLSNIGGDGKRAPVLIINRPSNPRDIACAKALAEKLMPAFGQLYSRASNTPQIKLYNSPEKKSHKLILFMPKLAIDPN